VAVDAIGCLPAVIKVDILVSGGLVTAGDLQCISNPFVQVNFGSDRSSVGFNQAGVGATPCVPGRNQRQGGAGRPQLQDRERVQMHGGGSLGTIRSAVRLMRLSLKQSSSSPVQLRLQRYLRRRTKARGLHTGVTNCAGDCGPVR